jgi:ADP-ribose pyrophosphatase YjhB (NUDIX family)
MKRMIWRSGLLMVLLSGTVAAEAPAGMVLYFESGGEVFLLLAEHAGSGRGWAGFGGGPRDGESVAETAAHKGEEESRGYFKSVDLLKIIKDQAPVMDGDFASYFVRVDFVPAPSVMNHPVPEENDAYLERSTYAWMPYSAVAQFLQADIDRKKKHMIDPAFLPAGSETQWFWPIWLGNMRKAVATQSLPWQMK